MADKFNSSFLMSSSFLSRGSDVNASPLKRNDDSKLPIFTFDLMENGLSCQMRDSEQSTGWLLNRVAARSLVCFMRNVCKHLH